MDLNMEMQKVVNISRNFVIIFVEMINLSVDDENDNDDGDSNNNDNESDENNDNVDNNENNENDPPPGAGSRFCCSCRHDVW